MRILDRYILKSVLNLFIGCLLVFFFLYIIVDIFSHLDEILKNSVSLKILLKYYLSFLPIIFVQVSPVACLLSTLYTFGKLNRDNEIIAMRSAGLSIFQITKTILIFGIVTSVAVFWVNDRMVPRSFSITERIKTQMESETKKAEKKEPETLTNLSMYGLGNRLIFVNRFSIPTNTMTGVNILEHDEKQNVTKKIVANRGVFKDGNWVFYQSITYKFDSNGQIKDEPEYNEEEVMSIPETPQEFLNQRQRPEFMNIREINDYIWRLSKSGATGVIKNLKVSLYQRFTDPLTSIIIILLGIPFSFMMHRRATGLSAVGFSIILGFLYYVLNAVSIALGRAGVLIPILSASLPHIIALSFTLYAIRKLP